MVCVFGKPNFAHKISAMDMLVEALGYMRFRTDTCLAAA